MPLPPLTRLVHLAARPLARAFTTHPPGGLLAKPLPPRLIIPESDLEENFLKGSGPGGQKINKTSSAVQLKHLPTGIVVKCQDTRSRSLNRKTARKLLGEKIEEMELGEDARTRVKAREQSRRKGSAEKKKRRKYRALAEGSGEGNSGEGGEADGLAEAEGGRARAGGADEKSGG
jgi:hypothetical protein